MSEFNFPILDEADFRSTLLRKSEHTLEQSANNRRLKEISCFQMKKTDLENLILKRFIKTFIGVLNFDIINRMAKLEADFVYRRLQAFFTREFLMTLSDYNRIWFYLNISGIGRIIWIFKRNIYCNIACARDSFVAWDLIQNDEDFNLYKTRDEFQKYYKSWRKGLLVHQGHVDESCCYCEKVDYQDSKESEPVAYSTSSVLFVSR